jgi:hypothetical protein
MTKPIETQPGSPNFDGAEAYELYQSDMEIAYAKIQLLSQRYIKLLSRWAKIQHWYETADRSAHSWAELDKIMENQND